MEYLQFTTTDRPNDNDFLRGGSYQHTTCILVLATGGRRGAASDQIGTKVVFELTTLQTIA